LTAPIDFTDPKLVKACAHPLRIRILGLLDNRVASPSEIAIELGTPLSNTSYHVRQLAGLGFVKLVNRVPRRGAVEHYYTATVRPTITDDGWGRLPQIVRRAMMGAALQQAVAHVIAAAEDGGFDRDDIHYSRTAGRMDAKAWKAVARELTGSLKRIEKIVEESDERVARAGGDSPEVSTVVMMHFEGPTAKAIAKRSAAHPVEKVTPIEAPVAAPL
jgi:DNA-binding transcriptional ArsR family regulator